MLYKTRGIVLSYIKYRETSIIAKIYTEEFGLQSYIENGVRSSKGRGKIALFQSLNLVDLVVYMKQGKNIQRISEIKCPQPYFHISTDIKKSVIAMFITEVLNFTLRESEQNLPLFSFLYDSLSFLEEHEEQIENFHLYFLINLSGYLGFEPEKAQDITLQLTEYGVNLHPDDQEILDHLIQLPFGSNLNISRTQRLRILNHILIFYKTNLENFPDLKSINVLSEILHD